MLLFQVALSEQFLSALFDVYEEGAPLMKNHLSMLGSMGAGLWFSPAGMLTWLASMRSAERETVVLALDFCK